MKLVVLALMLVSSTAHADEPAARRYAAAMAGADVVILATAYPVLATVDDSNAPLVAGVYALAYLSAGAITHAVHDNSRQVIRSVGRRIFLPVGAGLVGFAIGSVAVRDCSGDLCGLGAFVPAVIGAGLGAIGAVIWDWTSAHVDAPSRAVTPVVAVDRERVAVGLAGAF